MTDENDLAVRFLRVASNIGELYQFRDVIRPHGDCTVADCRHPTHLIAQLHVLCDYAAEVITELGVALEVEAAMADT